MHDSLALNQCDGQAHWEMDKDDCITLCGKAVKRY